MDLPVAVPIIVIIAFMIILLCIQLYPYNIILPVITFLITIMVVIVIVYYQEYNNNYEVLSNIVTNDRIVSLPRFTKINSLKDGQRHINNALEIAKYNYSELLDYDSDKAIIDAINHALEGGKRLRGTLALDIASKASGGLADATETALALEYLHSASLIIDDMPHFDNDDMRRGRQSAHILYGAATCQMAATSLITLAMECLIRQGDQLRRNARNINELVRANLVASRLTLLISNTLGVNGAAGGQLAEYNVSKINKEKPPLKLLENIIHRKTGALFEAALVAGWIIGTSKREYPPSDYQNKLIKESAYHYGTAFQIADDIGDESKDILGGNGNINYCVVQGKSESLYQVEKELQLCKEKLEQLGLWSPVWEDTHNAARLMVSD